MDEEREVGKREPLDDANKERLMRKTILEIIGAITKFSNVIGYHQPI